MYKDKQEWLMHLRRFKHRETLEKIIEHNSYKLNEAELSPFISAADHRLAEIITGRLYDKVPKSVWTYVR